MQLLLHHIYHLTWSVTQYMLGKNLGLLEEDTKVITHFKTYCLAGIKQAVYIMETGYMQIVLICQMKIEIK